MTIARDYTYKAISSRFVVLDDDLSGERSVAAPENLHYAAMLRVNLTVHIS